MNREQFLTHCTAKGGNLSAMLMSGIKSVFSSVYETLPDLSYEFGELSWIIDCLLQEATDHAFICPKGRRRWVYDGRSLSMFNLTSEECAMPIADLFSKYGLEW